MRTNFYHTKVNFHFEEMRSAILEKLESHLPPNLYYHNLAHTLNVESAANSLAKKEGLGEWEIQLIRTAALYHDSGFIYQHHENESHAIQLAEQELPNYKYTNEEIQLICEMIHSTQSSSVAQNIYDEILSDADHDYFGRDDYFEIANRLRKEFEYYWKTFHEEEWIRFQLNYLVNSHVYLTQSAIDSRRFGKLKNIDTLKNQLLKLKK